MTIKDRIENEYFEWMVDLVCAGRFADEISYRKLLSFLHNTEFTYIIPRDENRASDGIDLRYHYVCYQNRRDLERYLDGPCSVLEMMIALAIRCETSIMDDPSKGDRTGQWFWGMIASLGLNGMYDGRFDRAYVQEVISRFLNREYEPNGRGGLFTIRGGNYDLRNVEIWYQLCWYLDSIV